jgi:hypothetical protein
MEKLESTGSMRDLLGGKRRNKDGTVMKLLNILLSGCWLGES